MSIAADSVVTFHYQLRSQDGEPIESSRPGEPMSYLHGHGNILPALEQAIAGHVAGDNFTVSLTADQAYGPRVEGSQQRVPVKHLMYSGKLQVGKVVKIRTEHQPRDVRIVKLGRHTADVDTNHPLAGMSLDFVIEIIAVRPASAEEIAHRHVHGPGGHAH